MNRPTLSDTTRDSHKPYELVPVALIRKHQVLPAQVAELRQSVYRTPSVRCPRKNVVPIAGVPTYPSACVALVDPVSHGQFLKRVSATQPLNVQPAPQSASEQSSNRLD